MTSGVACRAASFPVGWVPRRPGTRGQEGLRDTRELLWWPPRGQAPAAPAAVTGGPAPDIIASSGRKRAGRSRLSHCPATPGERPVLCLPASVPAAAEGPPLSSTLPTESQAWSRGLQGDPCPAPRQSGVPGGHSPLCLDSPVHTRGRGWQHLSLGHDEDGGFSAQSTQSSAGRGGWGAPLCPSWKASPAPGHWRPTSRQPQGGLASGPVLRMTQPLTLGLEEWDSGPWGFELPFGRFEVTSPLWAVGGEGPAPLLGALLELPTGEFGKPWPSPSLLGHLLTQGAARPPSNPQPQPRRAAGQGLPIP